MTYHFELHITRAIHFIDLILIRICICSSKGIFPQALINYITLSGGGFNRDGGLKPKSYSMSELVETVIFHIEFDSIQQIDSGSVSV